MELNLTILASLFFFFVTSRSHAREERVLFKRDGRDYMISNVLVLSQVHNEYFPSITLSREYNLHGLKVVVASWPGMQ